MMTQVHEETGQVEEGRGVVESRRANLLPRIVTREVPEDGSAARIAREHGVETGYEIPPALPKPPVVRPKSPILPDHEMPLEGETVNWGGLLRMDLPDYIHAQLREWSYRNNRTTTSAIMSMIADYRDKNGNKVFYVRPEDVVPDRRKLKKKK